MYVLTKALPCGLKYNNSFHKKNNTQGGHKYCEAMNFQSFDLTFRVLQRTFSNSIRYISKNHLNTTEIGRDLGMTENISDAIK